MKIKSTDRFEDVEVERITYKPRYEVNAKNIDDFREFMFDDQKIHRRYDKKFGLRHADGITRPIETFGVSGIIVESVCDDCLDWVGSQTIGTTVRDGAQAQRFLEYCLNNYSMMSDAPIQKTPYSEINFTIRHSKDGKLLNLLTDATTPSSSQLEKYCIFIEELNGDNTPKYGLLRRTMRRILTGAAIIASLSPLGLLYFVHSEKKPIPQSMEQIKSKLEQIQSVRNRYIMEYSEMRMHGQLDNYPSGKWYGYFSTGDPRYPQQALSSTNYFDIISILKSQEEALEAEKSRLLQKAPETKIQRLDRAP